MRIYNRKKRAISLVMAIMVMSSSIQITGLAEGEKEEGKKIIISEFQELPEELSSMKVPEGTSQEEFEKLFPDTLMVKTYRDDAEEQKPEQPTSAVTPTAARSFISSSFVSVLFTKLTRQEAMMCGR